MFANTRRFLQRLHRDEQGKMSVEMILLLALIALPIVILLAIFRDKIIGWFSTQSTALDQYNH
jgi:Flp pilus assembly pilin Flp